MMELVPELVDGAVVCRLENPVKTESEYAIYCGDLAILVHNWLVGTELKYFILDLQDEKDICPAFLSGILHLRKRMKMPFLFVGVLPQSEKIIQSYSYDDYPLFTNPEDAVRALRIAKPELTEGGMEKVNFGKAFCEIKLKTPDEEVETEEEAE